MFSFPKRLWYSDQVVSSHAQCGKQTQEINSHSFLSLCLITLLPEWMRPSVGTPGNSRFYIRDFNDTA